VWRGTEAISPQLDDKHVRKKPTRLGEICVRSMTGKEKLETFLHEEEMSKSLERTGRHTCRAAISNSSTF